MFLLTAKPIIYIANISEEQIGNAENEEMVKQVKEYAAKEGAEVIPLCVKIEEELSGLEDEDKKEMLEALGLKESGLDMVMLLLTDIITEGSQVLVVGERSDIAEKAFNATLVDNTAFLPGVLSRKKQVVPPVTNVITNA